MFHQEGKHVWDAALVRVISVLAGCVLGLIITFIFHLKATSKNVIAETLQQEA
jgi:phage shock protein PspC (stress-responsive transcriptional regulator)